MFREESVWIKECLSKITISSTNNRAANLGSSNTHLRTVIQPHIHQNLIEPLVQRGVSIVHIDFKKDDGVDVVADLTNANFGADMAGKFALTICTNMLEHVENIPLVVNNLMKITSKDGYILLTVPYKYKIHHDPIDNGFRPTPQEIADLFKQESIEVFDKKIIIINDKQYYTVKKSKFPVWGHREIINYHLGIKHKVSGILIKKK